MGGRADYPDILCEKVCMPRTTILFAALDITSGTVFAGCKARHRYQEFLTVLRDLDTFAKRTRPILGRRQPNPANSFSAFTVA
jgi:hypothetical protein